MNTGGMEVDNYDVPVHEDQNSDVNIYESAMRRIMEMYPETITVNRTLNQTQKTIAEKLFTGAVFMKNYVSELAKEAIRQINEQLNGLKKETSLRELRRTTQLESQIADYLEQRKCVYVLGCEELEHERQLYDQASFNAYMAACDRLNLWTASEDQHVVNLANSAFKAHYASMGRVGYEPRPTRIGILLFLIELSFTGVPSYEVAPSTHPFTSMVENLYGAVVEERVELVNQYLANNVSVEFDKGGNIATIKPTAGPTGREPVKYGLTATLQQIHADFPVLGSMEEQIARHTEGMNALETAQATQWSEGLKLANIKNKEVEERLKKARDKRTQARPANSISDRRKIIDERRFGPKSLGGKKTHKRSKKHGKTHKKHRKANKKHSRRRGRK